MNAARHRSVALSVALATAATALVGVADAGAASSPARFSRVSQGGPVFTNLTFDAKHYKSIVIGAWFRDDMKRLKRINPKIKVYMYKNIPTTVHSTQATQDRQLITGVDFFSANRYHADWFLKWKGGGRVTRGNYGTTQYLMDIGSHGYQLQWAKNVTTQAKREGWSGVFMDDAVPTANWWLPGGGASGIAKYRSDPAWRAAMGRFLSTVGTSLRKHGVGSIANVEGDTEYHQRKAWASHLSGTLDEGFLNPTTGEDAPLAFASGQGWNDWHGFVKELQVAESQHRQLIAVLKGSEGNLRRERYGLATYLMAARGWTSYTYQTSTSHQKWYSDYSTAQRLGAAKSGMQRLSNGMYRRRFAKGVSLVNPSGRRSLKVSLGGTYSGSGLKRVRSVTLAPMTGVVLLKV